MQNHIDPDSKPSEPSPAKVAANRSNGALSRGPKTEQGKARSRWNALKHGLLARRVVIPEGEAKEDEKAFQSLLAALRLDLGPVGMLEEMTVEEIATCYWRLQRALGAEAANIRKGAEGIKQQMSMARVRTFEAEKQHVSEKGFHGFSASSEALKYQRQLLSTAIAEVEACGVLNTHCVVRLTVAFRNDADGFYERCNAADRDKNRVAMLQLLQQKERSVGERLQQVMEMEDAEVESIKRTLLLPSDQAMNSILRYETTIRRQLDKAMDRLACLQEKRRREAIPATAEQASK